MFKITTVKNFKSGQYISQGYYKSFQPEFINRQLHIDNMEVMQLLSEAGFAEIELRKDLSGNDRMLKAGKKEN